MRNLLLLFLAACGSDTFSQGGDGSVDGMMMMTGEGGGGADSPMSGDGDKVDSGCMPGSCPVEKIQGLDLPSCVANNVGGVFWTAETMNNNVGRYDKMQGNSSYFTIPGDTAIACALGDTTGSSFYAFTTAGVVMRLDTQLNPTMLAPMQLSVRRAAAAQDSAYVVWTHFDTIHGCGPGIMTCPSAIGFPSAPYGVDMDITNIYVAAQAPDNVVYRCMRPTGPCTSVQQGIQQATALHADGTSLYVSSYKDNAIYLVPKSGGSQSNFAQNQQAVRAIDSDGNDVYWITGDGNVVRSPKTMPAMPLVLAKGQTNVYDLTVDAKYVWFIRRDTMGAGGGLYRTLK